MRKIFHISTPIPTVSTDYPTSGSGVGKNVYTKGFIVTNTTAGALTFTMSDIQGTPRIVFNVVSVPANGNYVFNPNFEVTFANGLRLIASGAGLLLNGDFRTSSA